MPGESEFREFGKFGSWVDETPGILPAQRLSVVLKVLSGTGFLEY